MFPRLPAHNICAQILCPGLKKCFWLCSETFCVHNKCFPVCAAQETSWATMCPQHCVLVYQGRFVVFFTFSFCEIFHFMTRQNGRSNGKLWHFRETIIPLLCLQVWFKYVLNSSADFVRPCIQCIRHYCTDTLNQRKPDCWHFTEIEAKLLQHSFKNTFCKCSYVSNWNVLDLIWKFDICGCCIGPLWREYRQYN